MTRSLILLGAALTAVTWLFRQPAFAHDTPHKKLGALIAVTLPFLALDIILSIRKKRRARARSPRPQAGIRPTAGAGRW